MESFLRELEQLFWDARRDGDGEFYARMLRADAVFAGVDGLAGKDAVVARVAAGPEPFQDAGLTEVEFGWLGADAAYLAYRGGYTALPPGGEKRDLDVAVTSVYAREGGMWLLVLRHETPWVDAPD
ncbi:hypothetical protein GCM10022221_72590 [Actinocorallia aurea]